MTQNDDTSLAFLQTFFGDGNAIKWDQYEQSAPTDPLRDSLEPWVVRFQKQQSPFLLPRVYPSSTQTAWYVLCVDSRETRSMRESLQAFIGPTYTGFNGELTTLDLSDPIEHLCETNFGPLVFRLTVTNSSDRTQISKLLRKLVEYRDRESSRSLAATKPIGRLLRDLEMAVLANNEQSAWSVYSEIRSRGRLSATNLAFLQVRIYGAFEHWPVLLLLPSLNDLLQVRRPKQISEQIACAVYQNHLFVHEENGDAANAIDTYRGFGSRFKTLIRSTEGIQSPDAIKFTLVAAIASAPVNRGLAERLSEHPAIAMDATWVNALLALLPVADSSKIDTNVVTANDVADESYNQNNFDKALNLYLKQPQTHRSVCRVLETAVEVQSLQASEDALDYLSTAPDDIRVQVLASRVCTNNFEFLTRIIGQYAVGDSDKISSLGNWFDLIDDGEFLETSGEVLQHGIKDWISSSAFNPSITAEQLQKVRTGKQFEVIRNAVPIFFRTMLVDSTATRERKPVYRALTELLIHDESTDADDLTIVEQLTEAILTIDPTHKGDKNDFEFAVEIIVHLWDSIACPRHLDWALSMLDMLAESGADSYVRLDTLLGTIVDNTKAWRNRIREPQWDHLELIASEVGIPDSIASIRPPKPNETDPTNSLNGKSIAVYSTTKRIAQRFEQLARHVFTGITLHLIHDNSWTNRMEQLTQSADIFLINNSDAETIVVSHIEDNRPKGKPLLLSDSKAIASLLDSLLQYSLDTANLLSPELQAIKAEIESGEGDTQEFKSTYRWNIEEKKFDKKMTHACLKSIAAFLNTNGGILFIGVNDEGVPVGLEQDNFPNDDKFMLAFTTAITNSMTARAMHYIAIDTHQIDGHSFCRVACKKTQPGYEVWLKFKFEKGQAPTEQFFSRAGPQTSELTGKDLVDHMNTRRSEL